MSDIEQSKGEMLLYCTANGDVKLDVRLENETMWMTQADMAQLIQCSADNISLHLKNIYEEDELQEKATTEDYSVVRQEGKRKVKRKLTFYNLDAIISVGYRVKSKNEADTVAKAEYENFAQERRGQKEVSAVEDTFNLLEAAAKEFNEQK